MPILWSRFDSQSMGLVVAFLLVVVLPAHAFVVGFSRTQPVDARALDTASLKRVGVWLGTAVAAIAFTHFVSA